MRERVSRNLLLADRTHIMMTSRMMLLMFRDLPADAADDDEFDGDDEDDDDAETA